MRLAIEIFPVAPDRWVAVIEAPSGPFSTEAVAPERVPVAVRSSVEQVLGPGDYEIELLDERGVPWEPASALEQCRRLEVEGPMPS